MSVTVELTKLRGMLIRLYRTEGHGTEIAEYMADQWIESNSAAPLPGPLSKGADFRSWWERGLSVPNGDREAGA